nr:EOG090X0C3Y [Sida crystallina]
MWPCIEAHVGIRTSNMAAPGSKKRHVEEAESNSSSDSSDSEEINDQESDYEEVEDEELGENDREIQVDFEGQSPCSEDFAGIKNLLNQLFLKAHVDQSKLADLVIAQSHIGSVLKQCIDENDNDSDVEESLDEVFGISTVINLTHHQVCIPLLENLSMEIDDAKKKGEPFDFTHYILISKMHEASKSGSQASKKMKGANILWVNGEEESVAELGETFAEFSVRGETDAAVGGTWGEEDEQFDPKRRILVFSAKQWPEIIGTIKTFLN